jgi:uncharacterized protein (TIGR00369 family)
MTAAPNAPNAPNTSSASNAPNASSASSASSASNASNASSAPTPGAAPTASPDQATLLARLQHELAHPPFHALLGPQAVAVDIETGTVVIRLPYSPTFRRAADSAYIHGGVIAALIDMAAHAAVAVQTGRMAPTVDLRIDYLRPAPGSDLIATARVLRLGRAIARADVEVAGPGTQPYAVGRGTFSTLAPGA